MKVLINTKTKQILKEAKSIGQAWVDTQDDLELIDIENPVSNYIEKEDGTIEAVFRELLDEELLPFALKEKKELRTLLVSNIEVEYNGIVYQGDETSQDRISRVINGLPDDTTTISWKAKDNSSKELTRLDLKEILFLAVQEQARIWFS